MDTSGERHLLIATTEPLHAVSLEYAEYRESLGYAVTVVTTQQALEDDGGASGSLGEALRVWTTGWAQSVLDGASNTANTQVYLMIVGDALSSAPDDPTFVPVIQGEGAFVGDCAYGDLDGDGAPEVAIGRLPMRQPAEVRAYLDRVKIFESERPLGPWNKLVSVSAGEGGFGPEIDTMLEFVTTLIFEALTYDVDVTMAYASPTSLYYLPAAEWDAKYVENYQAGSVLQPYIGHTMGWSDTAALAPPVRRGMMAHLSCGDGTFQTSVNGLDEDLLLLPAGPIASLGASDWSHPYGNAVIALELSFALLNDRAPTYGMALAWAKQKMLYPDHPLRTELDRLAEAFVDEPMDHLVRTHAVMYNLLGDPAVDPGLPQGRVQFDGPEQATIGNRIAVTGQVTTGRQSQTMSSGEVTITLECERGDIIGDLVSTSDPPTAEEAAINHAAANNKVVVQATGPVRNGAFNVQLYIPATGLATGPYVLKGYAWSDSTDAMGSAPVTVIR